MRAAGRYVLEFSTAGRDVYRLLENGCLLRKSGDAFRPCGDSDLPAATAALADQLLAELGRRGVGPVKPAPRSAERWEVVLHHHPRTVRDELADRLDGFGLFAGIVAADDPEEVLGLELTFVHFRQVAQ